MSVFVTGVPTRKRAKRKLKTRDVDPRGATYSKTRLTLCKTKKCWRNTPARIYSSAKVLPISCDRLEDLEI